MKKIYNYIIVCAVAAMAFTSCRPLNKTYDEIGPAQTATPPPVPTPPTTDTIALTTDDYFFLPAINPAQGTHFFASVADAINGIPFILDKKYPDAVDKSQITVSFALSPTIPAPIALVDSTFTHVAYTLTDADYLLVPGNTFKDLSDADLMNKWLPNAGNPTHAVGTSFGAPVNNTLALVTWTQYNAGVTTPGYTGSFLYTGGAWQKIYTITPAQYTSIGKGGTSNDFAAADESTLAAYFNAFLKADPIVSITATVGSVQYVSFKYYGGSAAKTYQRIKAMVFDGTNWIAAPKTADPLVFGKTGGQWGVVYDNSVSYTLTKANYATIAAISGIASTGATGNLAAHNTFALAASSSATVLTDDGVRWTDTQIANAVIAILKAAYPSASTNQKFTATFATFGAYPTETALFIFDGTNFVYQPIQSQVKYTLTGDDYTAIARGNTGAVAAAALNLYQFGDFNSSWTQDNINAGINIVLKTRYTTPTANQTVAVTYATYNGGNVINTKNYKFNGTDWALAQ